jgi:hypothetical protein
MTSSSSSSGSKKTKKTMKKQLKKQRKILLKLKAQAGDSILHDSEEEEIDLLLGSVFMFCLFFFASPSVTTKKLASQDLTAYCS